MVNYILTTFQTPRPFSNISIVSHKSLKVRKQFSHFLCICQSRTATGEFVFQELTVKTCLEGKD